MILKQEFNMTSTFKQELKKPDSKTLKFPGEEKRKTNQVLESRSSRSLMSLEGRSKPCFRYAQTACKGHNASF
jgi:hypothetical protein